MNYLAHAFLSFDDPELLAGQFIADDIKGKKYLEFPKKVREGILLHRFVDDFTDTFHLCLELRAEIRGELGLFSGIAIDVYFDHLLSIHWEKYTDRSRDGFIQQVYRELGHHSNIMTEKRKFIIEKMIEHDWLSRYNTLKGTELTLIQMSHRVPNGLILKEAAHILEKHKKKAEEVFEIFFPKLISASKTKLDTFAA